MVALASIPPKVRSLVPVLGSDNDHEALGAARAIKRTLHGAGLDFHVLAASIGTGPRVSPVLPSTGGAAPVYRSSQREVCVHTPKQQAAHRQMVQHCRKNDRGRLSARERMFVASLAHIRDLTIRQADWLTDICDRLEQEDRL